MMLTTSIENRLGHRTMSHHLTHQNRSEKRASDASVNLFTSDQLFATELDMALVSLARSSLNHD